MATPKNSSLETEIHTQTVAEINRQIAQHTEKRGEITKELAAIFAARSNGQGIAEIAPPPLVRATRERAREMLNGSAPDFLKRPVHMTREAELAVDRDAIDMVIKILSKEEVAARATEMVVYAETIAAEWKALCRAIMLTALRLEALEGRAHALRAPLAGTGTFGLPMLEFIGTGLSVTAGDGFAAADPLSRPRTEALALGIITRAEIRAIEEGKKFDV